MWHVKDSDYAFQPASSGREAELKKMHFYTKLYQSLLIIIFTSINVFVARCSHRSTDYIGEA